MELNNLSASEKENIGNLTKTQYLYYAMMKSKSGVLYIYSKPGVAKTAMINAIARKMKMNYLDVRLAQIDEADLSFPTIQDTKDGKFVCNVPPLWAHKANETPTIICFEELNRAPLAVRNAALQMLLERRIGTDFKFNDNVLMVATGNLGTEDNCDTEEFDGALNNRLIHYEHELNFDEWVKDFANDNVHIAIIDYLKNHPESFYVDANENHKAYATPRSWTFLSDFIITNFGKKSDIKSWLPLVSEVGTSFIGNTFVGFSKYCENQLRLTIHDVLENFDGIKESLKKEFKRDKISELITSLKDIDITKLPKKQQTNLIKFLTVVDQDERCGYLIEITDKYDEAEFEKGMPINVILSAFKDDVDRMQAENDKQI